MPGEPQGPSYTAPPSIVTTVEGERIRSVEDFLSRRIKAKYSCQNGFKATAPGGVIPWDFKWYDTSGLYPQNNGYFMIPPGAEGDYLVVCQVSIVNSSANEYSSRVAIRVREAGWAENSFRTLGEGFVQTSGDPELNVVGEYTLRAGDRIFAFFSAANYDFVTVQGSVNSTFITIRRLV